VSDVQNAQTTPNGTRKRVRRRKNPGDIASLRRVLWQAIRDVEQIIADPPDGVSIEQRLRAVQALATISGVYLRATEQHELVGRIEALEARARQDGMTA